MNSSTVSCSPYIPTVYRLRDYGGNGNEMRNGILVSCLKLTRTSIWFDFSPCECGKLPLDLDYAYPINANPYSSGTFICHTMTWIHNVLMIVYLHTLISLSHPWEYAVSKRLVFRIDYSPQL